MSNYTKEKLVTNIQEVYDVHILALASSTFLLRDKSLELLKQNYMMHYGQVSPLKELAEELSDTKLRAQRTTQLISSSRIFFITEPINILNEFFDDNDTKHPFHLDWYLFGNTIRNFLTHGNLRYEQDYKRHKVVFPISWKNNNITELEVKNGKLDLTKFSHTYPLDLYNEILNFAKNL